jgi:hypothetical protein
MTFSVTARIVGLGIMAFGVAGCVDDSPSMVSTSVTPAQQACLAAVSNAANNGDVVVLSSLGSEAGTQVTVGVGPTRASWNCIAYSDGSTAGVQFNGSNG